MWLEFDVDLWVKKSRVRLFDGSEGLRLYSKFMADQSDGNFTELTEWLREEIAEGLEFDVMDVREIK